MHVHDKRENTHFCEEMADGKSWIFVVYGKNKRDARSLSNISPLLAAFTFTVIVFMIGTLLLLLSNPFFVFRLKVCSFLGHKKREKREIKAQLLAAVTCCYVCILFTFDWEPSPGDFTR